MQRRDLLPWLGSRPISAITPPELLAALRRIEARGAVDTTKRARIVAGQVFRYAVATGRAERDPTPDLRGAIAPAVKQHLAAITDPREAGKLLLAIDHYVGTPVVRAALRLAPLTFVRPGELRHARWRDFDLDGGEWQIPAERMKTRRPHLVPLSRQAVDILRDLHPLTGTFEFVFPSHRSPKRPMSENAVLVALRGMGYTKDVMTGHGFRAMARTILDEVLNYRVDLIEHQLAHAVRDANGRAYNRTAHLDARKKMMQGWADYLDELRTKAAGRNVVPIKKPKV
jgi:integrase